MRVLFTSVPGQGRTAGASGSWVPLALVHLAGVARAAGHDCAVLDAASEGMSVAALVRAVREAGPDVVCVSASTPGFPAALEVCRRVRAPGRATVLGGAHASFMYPEFLPEGCVDFVVVGEGEETLPELLGCLEAGGDPARVPGIAFALAGRLVRTGVRPRLAALDPLPMAWDLLPPRCHGRASRPGGRMAGVATSRGCPRRCHACPESALYEGTWRRRSVDAVAYELAMLRREHGVDVVAFHDPAPAADAGRFSELTERLAELDLGLEILAWACVPDILRDEARLGAWRDAGIVHVGVCRDPTEERLGGSARGRADDDGRRAVEALRRAGIASEAPFWLGFPDETPRSIEATLARAVSWGPDEARFAAVTPLPYTAAWRTWGDHVVTRDWRRFNQREPVVKPRHMELHEVAEALASCERRFAGARASPGSTAVVRGASAPEPGRDS